MSTPGVNTLTTSDISLERHVHFKQDVSKRVQILRDLTGLMNLGSDHVNSVRAD